jgi:predicted O-methyltransferase YrrM
MPVRLMEGGEVRDGLREVEGLPTGFMKIKRSVLEKMTDGCPWYFDKIYQTHLLFNRSAPDESHVRWGGDLDFCRRWRAMGGKIYALEDLRLGHVAKVIVYDSLAAHLRRLNSTTLTELAPKFREGTEDDGDYNEVFRYANNNFAADPGTLALCTGIARRSQGPIIETGSGLSTVLMAIASSQTVHSLEHQPHYAAQTGQWCDEAGVENYRLICAPLKDHWYDVERMDLPEKFAFGFCDGPPRVYGTRMRFFEVLGLRCSVIVVDDIKSDNNFARQVQEWAAANGRSFQILGRAALLTRD